MSIAAVDLCPPTERSRLLEVEVLARLREWLVPSLDQLRARQVDSPSFHYGFPGGRRVSVVLHDGPKAWVGVGSDVADACLIAMTEAARPADYEPVVEPCGCGRTHDERAWSALQCIGYQDLGDPEVCGELRQCECGSTRSREVPLSAQPPQGRHNPRQEMIK